MGARHGFRRSGCSRDRAASAARRVTARRVARGRLRRAFVRSCRGASHRSRDHRRVRTDCRCGHPCRRGPAAAPMPGVLDVDGGVAGRAKRHRRAPSRGAYGGLGSGPWRGLRDGLARLVNRRCRRCRSCGRTACCCSRIGPVSGTYSRRPVSVCSGCRRGPLVDAVCRRPASRSARCRRRRAGRPLRASRRAVPVVSEVVVVGRLGVVAAGPGAEVLEVGGQHVARCRAAVAIALPAVALAVGFAAADRVGSAAVVAIGSRFAIEAAQSWIAWSVLRVDCTVCGVLRHRDVA